MGCDMEHGNVLLNASFTQIVANGKDETVGSPEQTETLTCINNSDCM